MRPCFNILIKQTRKPISNRVVMFSRSSNPAKTNKEENGILDSIQKDRNWMIFFFFLFFD